jgi:hypothetical protein
VNLLAGAKTQSNPESCVGVLSLAGKVPKMLVTPTPDLGKVLNSMHDLQMAGHVNFATGVQARRAAARRAAPGASTDAGKPWAVARLSRRPADALCAAAQVAMLALKHRQNKSQRQRVVIFSGSPVADDEASLVKLGKKLKKNNVACDVVAFANVEENEAKLQARAHAAAASVHAAARVCVCRADAARCRALRCPPGVCQRREQQQQQQPGHHPARLAHPLRRPYQVYTLSYTLISVHSSALALYPYISRLCLPP